MTKLATTTVGVGGSATVSFTNIPQGYTDLKVLISTRGTASGVGGAILLSINGSTGTTNFTCRLLQGNGGIAASGSPTNFVGDIPLASATASVFGNIEITFSNYTSNNYKSYSIDSVTENNASGTDSAYADLAAGLWSQPSPITSLSFSQSSGSFVQHSTFTLYGIKNAQKTAGNSIKATGGNIVFDGTYVYHTFTSTGAFVPTQPLLADYLVVAGGGGGSGGTGAGGASDGGGGGGAAGGLRYGTTSLITQSYPITVGAGGAGGGDQANGANGSDTSFLSLTSTGGGRGGATSSTGATGGSGGGGSGRGTAGGSATAITQQTSYGEISTIQGYAGGAGKSGGQGGAGGGGGAGATGTTATTTSGAAGGVGLNWLSLGTFYAGGGGGGANNYSGTGAASAVGGSAGTGGGGAGGTNANGTAGTANTGGGGGGGALNTGAAGMSGAAGGSGTVIIRYKG
jgi:hypothetical protein